MKNKTNGKYFLDTSYIIGLALVQDNHHKEAMKKRDILQNNTCYVNNSVLNECISLAYNKTKNLNKANEIYYIINDIFNIINEYEIDNFNIKTLKVFNSRKGELSFIDSGIITTMKEHNIKNILTFDKALKRHKIQ